MQVEGVLQVLRSVECTSEVATALDMHCYLTGIRNIADAYHFASHWLAMQASGISLQAETRKPTWASGAKSAISLKPKTAATALSSALNQPQKKAWSLEADDTELVDEDSLLTEEDKLQPLLPGAQQWQFRT